MVGSISLLLYFPLDRRLRNPLPSHHPSTTHRLLLGVGLYYGVLAFNLGMTFWSVRPYREPPACPCMCR